MYDIKKDQWSYAPTCNIWRLGHSAVQLGKMIYIVCGTEKTMRQHPIRKFNQNPNIEILNAQAYINNEPANWELLNVEVKGFEERIFALVAPLSSNEILIMGGSIRPQQSRRQDASKTFPVSG